VPRILSQDDVSDFRERLCKAALKLFADKGVDGVTMRELAAAMGVSAMTPYRYFHDKNEILAAMRARAFDEFADALNTAQCDDRPGTVTESYVRFALGHPSEYALMFALNQPDENDYPELVRAKDRAKATMTAHIRPLVETGLFVGDPDLIGHVFWAMLHGAVTLHLAGKLGAQYTASPQYGIDRIVAEATRALAMGFGSAGGKEEECDRKTSSR
jgi:AcrR family transcriptional regulator